MFSQLMYIHISNVISLLPFYYMTKSKISWMSKESVVFGTCNKTNIFFGLIEYELNSLLGAWHLIDYISVHIRFDLERYLLGIHVIAGDSVTLVGRLICEPINLIHVQEDWSINPHMIQCIFH